MTIEVLEMLEVPLLGVLLVGGLRLQRRSRRISRDLQVLNGRIIDWCTSYDHQVASMDRRMRDVEETAARAAGEAQIVSAQMTDLNAASTKVLELVVGLHAAIRSGMGPSSVVGSGEEDPR